MSTQKQIQIPQSSRHESYDPNGYVFSRENRIFRAIFPQSQEHILALFNSGLIGHLVREGVFPESHVTDYTTQDNELIIEHRKIPVITFPHEWSFSMLKDAALAVLRVNRVARDYGYQTLDAHGFNILFYRGKPQFIDLGSIIRLRNEFNCKAPGWRPCGEFMRSFYAPLKLWSKGEEYLGKHTLYGDDIPMAVYWRIVSIFWRFVPRMLLDRFEFFWYKYKGLNTASQTELLELVAQSESRTKLARLIIDFSEKHGLPFSSIDLDALERKIERIKPAWGVPPPSGNLPDQTLDSRHQFVLEFIAKAKPESVLEIVDRSEFLCQSLVAIEGVDHVICAGRDVQCIDSLYCHLQSKQLHIYPMVFNIAKAIGDLRFLDENSRIRSDAVIALNLTHELILAQKLTLSFVMHRLRQLTNQYVVVEFKPRGLCQSKQEIGRLPDWYTLEWFRNGFEATFDLIQEKRIDPEHVILVGELKREGSQPIHEKGTEPPSH